MDSIGLLIGALENREIWGGFGVLPYESFSAVWGEWILSAMDGWLDDLGDFASMVCE